ncbi:hypothetical protein RhiirC2_794392 [Rhizophagus irregularis]|uniref:Uncharacterized protein n=1 Tax=Rhizophagus irregularis TaxID=588596 RepID=A0A2N1MDM1_9GLOM|nr:hypothetical protein RhiirC2_794392 [Rhizophagus irregularis]
MDASAIKRRYEWQAYRKLDIEELEKKDEEIIKNYNATFGNLQIHNGRRFRKRFKVPTQTKKDKFVDAQSDILSTIPRTEEEHADFDALNNNFSDRLNKIEKKLDLPKGKDKKMEETMTLTKIKKA